MAKKKVDIGNNLIEGLLTILLGVLFLILQGNVISIAMTVIGVMFIVLAVMDFVAKDVLPGVVKAVIGVVTIVFGWAFVSVALIVMGVVLIIRGVYGIYLAIKTKANIFAYVGSALSLVIGVLLLIAWRQAVDTYFIVSGIILIVEGVLTIFGAKK